MNSYVRTLAHLKSLLRHPVDYLKTLGSFRPRTDVARWSDPSSLRSEWDQRTRLIADQIPDESAVIEFGAARLVLPQYLGPRCTYQPVDIVSRSADTLVLDLNGPLPALGQRYDVAVFSGVLEYVLDIDKVFGWLPDVASRVVFSYAVTDFLSDPVTRRRNGWVNSRSDAEVRRMIHRSGLECLSTHRWHEQIIYSCRYGATFASHDGTPAVDWCRRAHE